MYSFTNVPSSAPHGHHHYHSPPSPLSSSLSSPAFSSSSFAPSAPAPVAAAGAGTSSSSAFSFDQHPLSLPTVLLPSQLMNHRDRAVVQPRSVSSQVSASTSNPLSHHIPTTTGASSGLSASPPSYEPLFSFRPPSQQQALFFTRPSVSPYPAPPSSPPLSPTHAGLHGTAAATTSGAHTPIFSFLSSSHRHTHSHSESLFAASPILTSMPAPRHSLSAIPPIPASLSLYSGASTSATTTTSTNINGNGGSAVTLPPTISVLPFPSPSSQPTHQPPREQVSLSSAAASSPFSSPLSVLPPAAGAGIIATAPVAAYPSVVPTVASIISMSKTVPPPLKLQRSNTPTSVAPTTGHSTVANATTAPGFVSGTVSSVRAISSSSSSSAPTTPTSVLAAGTAGPSGTSGIPVATTVLDVSQQLKRQQEKELRAKQLAEAREKKQREKEERVRGHEQRKQEADRKKQEERERKLRLRDEHQKLEQQARMLRKQEIKMRTDDRIHKEKSKRDSREVREIRVKLDTAAIQQLVHAAFTQYGSVDKIQFTPIANTFTIRYRTAAEAQRALHEETQRGRGERAERGVTTSGGVASVGGRTKENKETLAEHKAEQNDQRDNTKSESSADKITTPGAAVVDDRLSVASSSSVSLLPASCVFPDPAAPVSIAMTAAVGTTVTEAPAPAASLSTASTSTPAASPTASVSTSPSLSSFSLTSSGLSITSSASAPAPAPFLLPVIVTPQLVSSRLIHFPCPDAALFASLSSAGSVSPAGRSHASIATSISTGSTLAAPVPAAPTPTPFPAPIPSAHPTQIIAEPWYDAVYALFSTYGSIQHIAIHKATANYPSWLPLPLLPAAPPGAAASPVAGTGAGSSGNGVSETHVQVVSVSNGRSTSVGSGEAGGSGRLILVQFESSDSVRKVMDAVRGHAGADADHDNPFTIPVLAPPPASLTTANDDETHAERSGDTVIPLTHIVAGLPNRTRIHPKRLKQLLLHQQQQLLMQPPHLQPGDIPGTGDHQQDEQQHQLERPAASEDGYGDYPDNPSYDYNHGIYGYDNDYGYDPNGYSHDQGNSYGWFGFADDDSESEPDPVTQAQPQPRKLKQQSSYQQQQFPVQSPNQPASQTNKTVAPSSFTSASNTAAAGNATTVPPGPALATTRAAVSAAVAAAIQQQKQWRAKKKENKHGWW